MENPGKLLVSLMPTTTSESLVFIALSVCTSPKGFLPKYFQDMTSKIYGITEFKKKFALQKWDPILIATGIAQEDFYRLIENDVDYGKSFYYDFDSELGGFFIIDSPSYQHEYYIGQMIFALVLGLNSHFLRANTAFDILPNPSVPVDASTDAKTKMPDLSVSIPEKFLLDPSIEKIPFLIVEVAVSQRLSDLENKMNFWKKKGVCYVIGFNRDAAKKEVNILFIANCVVFPVKTFKFGDIATFDFHLSKQLITSAYNISEFEINSNCDDIHIILESIQVI
jgi:hypothetical protein